MALSFEWGTRSETLENSEDSDGTVLRAHSSNPLRVYLSTSKLKDFSYTHSSQNSFTFTRLFFLRVSEA